MMILNQLLLREGGVDQRESIIFIEEAEPD